MKLAYDPITGFGRLGLENGVNNGVDNFAWTISTTIGIVTVIGGIYFIVQIFTAAVTWISSGADKDGVQRAQKKFMHSAMGLAVLVFAYSLIAIVGNLLGIDILDFSGLFDKVTTP